MCVYDVYKTAYQTCKSLHERCSGALASAGREQRAFAPLEIATKNQKFLENLASAAQFR